MARSTKTTAAGVLTALGLIFSALGKLFRDGGPGLEGLPEVAPELVGAIGAALLGLFARDYNVSSEGQRVTPAPKLGEPGEPEDEAPPGDLLP